MKKLVMIMLLIAIFAIPVNAFAASKDEIKLAIKTEQKVYTKYSTLAGELLAKIIKGNFSVEEVADFRLQLADARKKYKESADKMLKLRIELYELTD